MMVSTVATANTPAKLPIEKGLITKADLMKKLSAVKQYRAEEIARS